MKISTESLTINVKYVSKLEFILLTTIYLLTSRQILMSIPNLFLAYFPRTNYLQMYFYQNPFEYFNYEHDKEYDNVIVPDARLGLFEFVHP